MQPGDQHITNVTITIGLNYNRLQLPNLPEGLGDLVYHFGSQMARAFNRLANASQGDGFNFVVHGVVESHHRLHSVLLWSSTDAPSGSSPAAIEKHKNASTIPISARAAFGKSSAMRINASSAMMITTRLPLS
jgi:hypothetical protein